MLKYPAIATEEKDRLRDARLLVSLNEKTKIPETTEYDIIEKMA
jgi:hypothetical protein